MDYLALYRKYRPKEFNDVVGQDEIKKILLSSVKNNMITHAYLFSGPRGTGKTTMAKILAKMVNCESPVDGNPCNKCSNCMNVQNSSDIIEIDAASNNGVDEIRELREKANLVPSSLKYKVYIIDEVHMLTTQAFNALLKTLEEPPKHVIFILATTEYYKIPLTITSRCQKFQFNKIEIDDIVKRLKEIAELENITISDDALFEIAKMSDGGMRDSINFLDQLRSFSNGNINIDDVLRVCGNISVDNIVELLLKIRNNDVEFVSDFFEKMNAVGKSYNKFFEDFIEFLNNVVLVKNGASSSSIRYDYNLIRKVCDVYDEDKLFYIIESVNGLIDRLKYVSRSSVFVISSFLTMMYNMGDKLDSSLCDVSKNNDNDYEMAFNFTSNEEKSECELTPDNLQETNDSDNINNVLLSNKNVIINNTFAVADKKNKENLQGKYMLIENYLTDTEFSSIASILVDTAIQAAGDGYLIISANCDAVVDKVYSKYNLCCKFFKKLFGSEYNFAVITELEWEKYKEEFIKNKKNGVTYELKPLADYEEKVIDSKVDIDDSTTAVDRLIDIVGDDIIEFRNERI